MENILLSPLVAFLIYCAVVAIFSGLGRLFLPGKQVRSRPLLMPAAKNTIRYRLRRATASFSWWRCFLRFCTSAC